MVRLRLICAVLLLVFAPLSGAFAGAHHHCHDVWHGHADDVVAAGDEDCDSQAPNLELANCDECQFVFAALPIVVPALEPAEVAVPAEQKSETALAHRFFSLFRPPIA